MTVVSSLKGTIDPVSIDQAIFEFHPAIKVAGRLLFKRTHTHLFPMFMYTDENSLTIYVK